MRTEAREARGGREVRPRDGKEGRDSREVRPRGGREVNLREAARRGRRSEDEGRQDEGRQGSEAEGRQRSEGLQ